MTLAQGVDKSEACKFFDPGYEACVVRPPNHTATVSRTLPLSRVQAPCHDQTCHGLSYHSHAELMRELEEQDIVNCACGTLSSGSEAAREPPNPNHSS